MNDLVFVDLEFLRGRKKNHGNSRGRGEYQEALWNRKSWRWGVKLEKPSVGGWIFSGTTHYIP